MIHSQRMRVVVRGGVSFRLEAVTETLPMVDPRTGIKEWHAIHMVK